MERTKFSGGVLAAAVVLTLTLSGASATHTSSSSSVQMETNGLSPTTVAWLWSGDPDDGTGLTSLSHFAIESPTNETQRAFERAARSDELHKTPPQEASTWTKEAWNDVPPGDFRQNTSYYPRGVEVTSEGESIRGAHTTIFATSPSTIVHSGNETTRYIAQKGTVYALTDFRIRDFERTVDTDPAGEDVVRRVEYVRIRDAKVNATYLLADGEEINRNTAGANLNGRPTQREAFTYDLSDQGDVDELEARSTIKVRYAEVVKKSVKKTIRVPVIPDDVDVRGLSPSELERLIEYEEKTVVVPEYDRTTTTETLNVSDTSSVEVYSLSEGDAEGYTAPAVSDDQPRRYALLSDDLFAGYILRDNQLGSDDKQAVWTEWRFMTARDGRWDTLQFENSTDSGTVASAGRPVDVHAVPYSGGRTGEHLSTREHPVVDETWGEQAASPETIPSGFLVAIAGRGGEYTQTKGISAHHSASPRRQEMRVVGLVRGQNATIDRDELVEREARTSNLSLAVVNETENTTTLQVTLRDEETGRGISVAEDSERYDPIKGDQQRGQLVIRHVASDSVVATPTPDDGRANITVERKGLFRIVYKPVPWYSATTSYSANSAFAESDSLPRFMELLNLIFQNLLWFIPAFLLLYAGLQLRDLINGGQSGGRR